MHTILMLLSFPYFELCHVFGGFIRYLNDMTLFYFVLPNHGHIRSLSVFAYGTSSLPASGTISVSFIEFVVKSNKFSTDQQLMRPSLFRFSVILLTAYERLSRKRG